MTTKTRGKKKKLRDSKDRSNENMIDSESEDEEVSGITDRKLEERISKTSKNRLIGEDEKVQKRCIQGLISD